MVDDQIVILYDLLYKNDEAKFTKLMFKEGELKEVKSRELTVYISGFNILLLKKRQLLLII